MKDVIKPTVTFNPSNGSIKIPGNRDITITYNERMRKIDDSEITNANVASLTNLKAIMRLARTLILVLRSMMIRP